MTFYHISRHALNLDIDKVYTQSNYRIKSSQFISRIYCIVDLNQLYSTGYSFIENKRPLINAFYRQ